MKTTTLALILAAMFLGGLIVVGQTAQETKEASMSVADLMRLLPAGPDMDSPDDLRNLQTLKSVGSRLLPVIAEAMDHSTNVVETSRLVALAIEIPGDRSPIIPGLHRLLDNGEKAKMLAILALRDIGSTSDCPRLLPLLNDPSEAVRINTARTLARLGDDKTLEEMAQVVKKRKAELNAEELHKDYSISEIEKAITALEKKAHRHKE